jgi:drug/metabolite transporter (DMT)-like permease
MNLSSVRSWQPYVLLALANLFWSGNWVIGRALREAYAPVALNLWRWLLAAMILAPFALPLVRGKWRFARQHCALLALLAATGGALFHSMVYVGLRSTTAVNAALLSASAPLFVMLCAWVLEHETATTRQFLGMLVSFGGIVIILGRGDPSLLLHLDFHAGDLWILLAMPVFGIYSVLLKRVPRELRGSFLLFSMAVLTVPMLAGPFLLESQGAPALPAPGPALLGVAYTALFASVLAFTCWNRAVATLGANVAGLSLPLMPAFATVLAMIFLREQLHAFHVAGIGTILLGVAVATRPAVRATGHDARSAAAPAR